MRRIVSEPGRRMRRYSLLAIAALAVGITALSGCSTGAYPVDFFQEMHYSPSVRRQEAPVMSVSGDAVAFRSGGSYEQAVNADTLLDHYDFLPTDDLNAIASNPVVITPEIRDYSAMLFQRNCAMCHGAAGDGEGLLQIRIAFEGAGMNAPKDLTAADTQDRTDGEIYAIVTRGTGDVNAPDNATNAAAYESMTAMPPFQRLLTPGERWILVEHIRTLDN